MSRLTTTPNLNIDPNEGSSISQRMAILAHLKNGNTITGLEAIDRFGCIKLSNRISELRSSGHDIKDQWIETPTGKRVKQYFMEREA